MTKPTLIYLPGLDGTGKLLHRQQDLYEDYHVLCESYPQDRAATYEELADTAAKHLAEASGGQPGIVLAESFGGAVGLLLALRHAELVERIVLVNTFAYFPKRWLIRLGSWLGPCFPNRPSPAWTRGIRGRFFFSKDILPEERQAWWERTAGVPALAMGRRMAMIAALDLRPRLKEITTPTIIIAAPDDRVVPPNAGLELAKLLPHAKVLQPCVGHAALIHPKIKIRNILVDWSL